MTAELPVADIRSYLAAAGWVRQERVWRGASVWVHEGDHEILVPGVDGLGDGRRRVQEIVALLSVVEGRSREEVASDIGSPAADVQWYRAPVVPLGGQLGLADAVAAVTGVHEVLHAAARAAWGGPRALFDGVAPREVRDLLTQVRIGPLVPSGDQLTVRIPLDTPAQRAPQHLGDGPPTPHPPGETPPPRAHTTEAGPDGQLTGRDAAAPRPRDGAGTSGATAAPSTAPGAALIGPGVPGMPGVPGGAGVSLARRTSVLLQRVLVLLREAAAEAGRSGDVSVFDPLVREGASAELCLALARFAGPDPGARFEVGFRWARALPSGTPAVTVVFEPGTGMLLRRVAHRYRRLHRENATVTGLVGALFDNGGSDRFRVQVRGRVTAGGVESRGSIWVRLPGEAAYDLAVQAHRNGTPVRAQGALSEVNRRRELGAVTFETQET